MSDGGSRRSLAGWLARAGAALRGTLDYAELSHTAGGTVHPSKGLPRFMTGMRRLPAPVIVDLGSAIGQNVTFLGNQLGCKLHIEDVFGDVDRLKRAGQASEIAGLLGRRFTHADASIDGVLCWDLIDHLRADGAAALAGELTRIVKPGGLILAQFATVRSEAARYRKYAIVDECHLQHRNCEAAQAPERLWSSRDVQRLFGTFAAEESFLLLHRQRETLLRKGAALDGGR